VTKLKLEIQPLTEDLKLVSANNDSLSIIGYVDVMLNVKCLQIPHCLFVLKTLSQPIILGNDFMRITQCVIDYGKRCVTIFDDLIVIPLTTRYNKNVIARLERTIVVPPHTEVITSVSMPKQYMNTLCLLETHAPIKKQSIFVAAAVVQPEDGKAICRLCNTSNKPCTLVKNTPVASIEVIDVREPINLAMLSLTLDVKNTPQENSDAQQSSLSHDEKLQHLREIGLKLDNDNLTAEQMRQLVDLLYKYEEIFCADAEQLPISKLPPVEIKLKNNKPIRSKRYPLSHQHEILLDKYIESMLKAKIIRPSHSAFHSPAIVIKKRNYDPADPLNLKGVRVAIDYRNLNSSLMEEYQALISIDTVLSQVSDAQAAIYSTFDFTSGFLQLPLHENSTHITSFSSRSGSYEYLRCPMGISTSPSQFISSLYNLFQSELKSEQFVLYSDDGFIFTKTFAEQIKLLDEIFTKIKVTKLRINPTKSEFCKPKLEFLSYEFSKEGIRIAPSRISKIKSMTAAKNIKQMRGLYGFFSYFRKFCPNYAQLTHSWRQQMKTDHKFEWTDECEKTLQILKEMLLQNALVYFPDLNAKFFIETDASSFGISSVLLQEFEGVLRPIAFAGRAMKPRETTLSAADSELLAILHAMSTYRMFLNGPHPVTIITDHCSLQFISQLEYSSSPKLCRYSMLLQSFRYKILYRPGKKNVLADYLSRYPTDDNEDKDKESDDPIMDVAHYDYLASLNVPELISENTIRKSENEKSIK
jgi:hypothetical protein